MNNITNGINTKFGGWWRLWIVIVCIYGIILSIWFGSDWPTLSEAEQGPWLVQRMSDTSRKLLENSSPKMADLFEALVIAHNAGDTNKARSLANKIRLAQAQPWTLDPIVVETANGNSFKLPSSTTKTQVAAFSEDYSRVLNTELSEKKRATIKVFLVVFLAPSMALLLLGLATNWIKKGFKSR